MEEKEDSDFPKYLKKMNGNTELNRYFKEFDVDTKLTRDNLREKSLLCSTIRNKWLNYLLKEQENLRRIKETRERILKGKMKSSGSQSILKMKSEDNLSKDDENIQKLNRLQDMTKENISYLEQCMNILNDFGFQIKNSIDIIKLETI